MFRLASSFVIGLLLFFVGWEFYSNRSAWQAFPLLFSSLPSFVYGMAVVLVGALLLAHTKRNFILLTLLVAFSEIGQSVPVWNIGVRFDWLDLTVSLLGVALSYLLFWRSIRFQMPGAWPVVLVGAWAAVVGCTGPQWEPDIAEPVVVPRSLAQQDIKMTSWRAGLEYQRLYEKDGFLFGIVLGEGVQIIDNSDPFQPKALNFIHIPGSHEVVIQGDQFIANNYSDMVIFSKTEQKELSRIPDLYSYRDYIELPPDTIWNDSYVMPENSIAVDYKIVEDDDDREKKNEKDDPVCIVLLCMFY